MFLGLVAAPYARMEVIRYGTEVRIEASISPTALRGDDTPVTMVNQKRNHLVDILFF